MDLIHEVVKLIFTAIQFANIIGSCILIGTGIMLFQYIRKALLIFDQYIHVMVALHVVASILILSCYELQSAELMIKSNMFAGFRFQLSIMVLVTINALFQFGIYKFFSDPRCDHLLIENVLYVLHQQTRAEKPVAPEAATQI